MRQFKVLMEAIAGPSSGAASQWINGRRGRIGMVSEHATHTLPSGSAQALAAGAAVVLPLQDQFYGERSGTVRDPFGHEWLLGGHIETVSTEEMQRRYTAMFK